jgi:hypothetical protein
MDGSLQNRPPEGFSYRGEVWTDARGQATVNLPAAASPPRAEVEYALRAVEGDGAARVIAELRDGRFTIETDHPHVKVAWRINRRKEESQ